MSIAWGQVPHSWRATPIAIAMAAAGTVEPIPVKVEMSPAEFVRNRTYGMRPPAKKMKLGPGSGD